MRHLGQHAAVVLLEPGQAAAIGLGRERDPFPLRCRNAGTSRRRNTGIGRRALIAKNQGQPQAVAIPRRRKKIAGPGRLRREEGCVTGHGKLLSRPPPPPTTIRSLRNRASISVRANVAKASSGVSTSGSCSLYDVFRMTKHPAGLCKRRDSSG